MTRKHGRPGFEVLVIMIDGLEYITGRQASFLYDENSLYNYENDNSRLYECVDEVNTSNVSYSNVYNPERSHYGQNDHNDHNEYTTQDDNGDCPDFDPFTNNDFDFEMHESNGCNGSYDCYEQYNSNEFMFASLSENIVE